MESQSLIIFVGNHEMKISFKFILAIIFLSMGLLVTYYLVQTFQGPNNSFEKEVNLSSDLVEPKDSGQATTAMPDIGTVTKLPEKSDTGKAIDLMQNSRDYRAVMEKLAQAGTEEAGLYADTILKQCYMIIRSGVQGVKTASTKQDQAKELLWSRCSSFSSDEISAERVRQLESDPRFPKGLMELRSQWNEVGRDSLKQQEILGRIFHKRDPILLEQAGLGLIASHDEKINLDGTEFSGGNALAAVRNSWIAAVCEGTGSDCGGNDYYAVDMCANTGICENSRFEAFRSATARDQGDVYLKDFDSAYRTFVHAIKTGNSAIFFEQIKK
ncbi:hypothetical protein ABN448_07965 [Delftia acidovorans]|uniref:hypothetical protein n=1 Tax=Delftia acidovorans TaxID=80866 RepID=UPI0032DE33C1